MRCVGLINDDSNAVGQVHLGVVHLYELEEPLVSPRESGLAEAQFLSRGDVLGQRDRFETWSKICINELFSVPGSKA